MSEKNWKPIVMKPKKDDVEKFYRVEITRNLTWDREPAYLKQFGAVLARINSVFDTEKMQQHVRKIEGDYGYSHLSVMFKKPYFTMTKVLI